MSLKYGTTIKEMIEKYYNELLFNKNHEGLEFIYANQKINPNDITTIENYFKTDPNPFIMMIDVKIWF